MVCPSCRRENPDRAKFCDQCGAALAGEVASAPAKSWIVGSAPECDVRVDESTVSGRHCRLTEAGGGFILEDLGSTNGTWLDGRKIEGSLKVKPGDPVTLGRTVRLPWSRLDGVSTLLAAAPAAGQEDKGSPVTIHFHGPNMVLGRSPDCDWPLDHPMISWRHARLSQSNGIYTVEDLGSTNRTFVNGKPISGPTRVRAGDVIGLGSYTFQFTAEGGIEQRDYRGSITIEAKNVAVDVPGKRLIENVSLTIYPSEFVGLMGLAGAGKTTLLNALNGYTRPATGAVLINGKDLYAHHEQFRGQLGYAPQDDIMHRELTVGQALYYTARLRLPTDFSEAEIHKRIQSVLRVLAMEGTENVLIGSPEKKGISGGQRKRVNLAMELMTEPPVLFLDEPTSGLSSEDALIVMQLLRDLAKNGKTVLITIHQPSLEAFRMMDRLIVVGKDRGSPKPAEMVYFGPAYPDAIDFFNPVSGPNPSPDDILRGLSKATTGQWVARYSASPYKREFVEERSGKRPAEADQPRANPHREPGQAQWKILVRRSLTIKLQDRWYTAILLGQAPLIAFLVVLVCGTDRAPLALFAIIVAALFAGCLNASREIVGEWAVYHRERMVNLKIPSYVASKFTVLGGLCVIQCLILLGVSYAGCNLKGPFIPMLVLLTLTSIVALAIGLTLSAFARTSEVAIATILPVLIPMLLLGGAVPPLRDVARPIARLNPARWSFEGLLSLEKSPGGLERFFPSGQDQFGLGTCVLVLLMMLALLTVGILAILRSRDV